MSSLKQLEANRRNAQRSTGPRTPEGKSRASRNALVHGILSSYVVLEPEEDPAKFQALLEEFLDEWQPETVTEHALVAEMANAQWRLARLRRMESAIVARSLEQISADKWGPHPPPPDPWLQEKFSTRFLGDAASADTGADRQLGYLARLEGTVRRAFYRALRELQRLRAFQHREPVETEPVDEPRPQPVYPVPDRQPQPLYPPRPAGKPGPEG